MYQQELRGLGLDGVLRRQVSAPSVARLHEQSWHHFDRCWGSLSRARGANGKRGRRHETRRDDRLPAGQMRVTHAGHFMMIGVARE